MTYFFRNKIVKYNVHDDRMKNVVENYDQTPEFEYLKGILIMYIILYLVKFNTYMVQFFVSAISFE